MLINVFILVLVAHWLGDYVFQTNKMANNKADSNFWLLMHSMVYGGVFSIIIGVYFYFYRYETAPFCDVAMFIFYNSAIHLFIDAFTAKITKRLRESGINYWYYIGLGFDQLLHVSILYYSYIILIMR